MRVRLIIACLLFLCSGNSDVHAQRDTTSMWSILTKDGNEYVGKILSRIEEKIELETLTIGIISIRVSDIKRMVKADADDLRGTELWLENPQESRYFIFPSSYGSRKGEAYYQNVWIFFNQFTYGLSDHLSIGLGTVPLFLFSGTSTPVWITPKISVPLVEDQLALGGGGLFGTVVGESESSFGIFYGTATLGSRDKNISLGIGYGYAGESFARRPTLSLSGMIRTGKRGYFITENYHISTDNENFGILSFGGRTVWTNISLDYGGFIPVGDDVDFGIGPWLGLVVRLD